MNEYVITGLLFGSAFLILMSGISIWAGLTTVALLFITIFSPNDLSTLPHVIYGSMNNFALLAIPMFILLSAALTESGAGTAIYSVAHKWLVKIPGGLGIASLTGCAIFAAMSGSSPATAAAVGNVAIPEMRKHGYSPALATGIIAHGGTFGILIPPSITMILYGISTSTSIGKLFVAGILPGLVLLTLSSIWVVIVFYYHKMIPIKPDSIYYINDVTANENFSFKEKLISLFDIFPVVILIIAIMVALYGGWATPSESAGVGAVFAILIAMIFYRFYKPKQLWRIFRKTINESTMILMIMVAALLFSFVSSDLYATQTLANWFLNLPLGKWGIIIIINIFLLIIGLFIPPAAVVLMVSPLLLPIIQGLGFNPIWFAVIMTINLEMGLVTPPVGLNLYIVKGIATDIPMYIVLRGMIPFFIIDIITIVIISIWPSLALYLPAKMFG